MEEIELFALGKCEFEHTHVSKDNYTSCHSRTIKTQTQGKNRVLFQV